MRLGQPEVMWPELSKLNHALVAKDVKNGEYFRFHLEFEGNMPCLDAVAEMPQLRRTAETLATDSEALKELTLRKRAQIFFFELGPKKDHGTLHTGRILAICESLPFTSIYHFSTARMTFMASQLRFSA